MSVSKANPLGNHLEITDSSKCLKVPDKIGIIGLGLIGGTLAKTIHRIYPDLPLIACDTDSKALASALKEGVIRQGFPGIDESFANCRYIFLCAPVEKNETFLSALAPFLSERCILTDTGSVKASIHEDMRRRGLSSFFIGGHPMAGSEKSGYENATPYLFENAYYIITNDGAAPALVAEYRNFIASLGCIPLLMSPWLVILMKNFVKAIPHEISEYGKIDGAGDMRIFVSLILPMLKPALATIGLFLALGYWNEWYQSSLFLTSKVDIKPLQYYLYEVVNKADALKNSVASQFVTIGNLPTETVKMANAMLATGPIILLYPFVQKYFISGLTVGAVKG